MCFNNKAITPESFKKEFDDVLVEDIVNEIWGSLGIEETPMVSRLAKEILYDIEQENYLNCKYTLSDFEKDKKSYDDLIMGEYNNIQKEFNDSISPAELVKKVEENINVIEKPKPFFKNIDGLKDEIYIMDYHPDYIPWMNKVSVIISNSDTSFARNHCAQALITYNDYTKYSTNKIEEATIVVYMPETKPDLYGNLLHEINHYKSDFEKYKDYIKDNVISNIDTYHLVVDQDLKGFYNSLKKHNIQYKPLIYYDFSDNDVIESIKNCGLSLKTMHLTISNIVYSMYFTANTELNAHRENIASEMISYLKDTKYNGNIENRRQLLIDSSRTYRVYIGIRKLLTYYLNNMPDDMLEMIFRYYKNNWMIVFNLYRGLEENKTKKYYTNHNIWAMKRVLKVLINRCTKCTKHVYKIFGEYYQPQIEDAEIQ